MLQAVLAAAGAGALLAYYYYKRATRVLLPLTLEDCRGHKVKIRLAVAEAPRGIGGLGCVDRVRGVRLGGFRPR